MSDNPLSGEVKLDVTNYKSGITELNRQIRVIESGFRASAAALGQWDKSAEGLEMRTKALTGSMDVQQKKVNALQQVYDELTSSGKASKKELEELQIKINKENETLGKMQSELNQTKTALDQMGDESKQTGTQIKELGDKEEITTEKSEKMKGALSKTWDVVKTGGIIVGGLAASVAGMAAGIGAMITKSAQAADEMVELSAKTGFSTQELQEMQYIAELTGTSLDTMTSANAKVVRAMDAAQTAGSDQANAFAALGVSIKDANGGFKASQDVLFEAADALGKIDNETERDILSNQIFGKSFQEMNPLIKAGADELSRMRDEARQNGTVMSTDATQGLADFNDMMAGMKLGLNGVIGELSSALLPGLQGLGGMAGGYLKDLVDVVKGADGDVGAMASGVGNLIGRMVADLAKQGPQLMKGGLGIINGLLNAVLTNLPVILPAVIEMVRMIVDFIIASLPMLITAAFQIIMMLMTGITQALPTMIPTITGIIPTIIQMLIENIGLLINAAMQMILVLAQGLVGALPILIDSIPTIINAMVDAIMENLPLILIAAVEIITTLAFGLVEAIPQLLARVAEIIDSLVEKFKSPEFVENLKGIGRDLLDTIWKGIVSSWDRFVKNFLGNFNDLLGIFGGKGIEVSTNISGGTGGRNNSRGLSGNGVWNADSFAFYAPVIIQEGSASGGLGAALKAKRY